MSTPPSALDSWSTVVHGVRVAGDTPLLPAFSSHRAWTHAWRVDYAAASAPAAATDGQLPGDLIAHQLWAGETEYAFSRRGDVVYFSFPNFCAGHADGLSGVLSLRAATADDASLVLPNTILAAILGPDGDPVLHASAVAIDGNAVAICGISGSGKSSIATALALQGAAVITDDALRLLLSPHEPPLCYPGVAELRLRQTRGWPLATECVRPLSDERTGYLPHHVVDAPTRVRCLLFPVVSASLAAPALVRLRGEQCLRRLLSASRIAWTPRAGAHFLHNLTRLSQHVTCYELHLPLHVLDDPTHHPALFDLVRHQLT